METKGFEAIRPLWDKMPLIQEGEKTPKADGGSLFADIFHSAVDNVRETSAEKNEKAYLLAVGELDNPAEYSTAAAKSGLALDLLIQLRNRSLEAYNELMRISI